jgi:hypothetical protein
MVQSPDFIPSERLIDIFVEGTLSYLERLKTASEDVDLDHLDLSRSRAATIIAERITDVLISLGGRRQAGVLNNSVIAKESFPEKTQQEILELLPVDDCRGQEFCQFLLEEVKAYLKGGGVIAGSWGHVAVREETGELVVADIKPLPARQTFPTRATRAAETIIL